MFKWDASRFRDNAPSAHGNCLRWVINRHVKTYILAIQGSFSTILLSVPGWEHAVTVIDLVTFWLQLLERVLPGLPCPLCPTQNPPGKGGVRGRRRGEGGWEKCKEIGRKYRGDKEDIGRK